jgi:hypothetical protein
MSWSGARGRRIYEVRKAVCDDLRSHRGKVCLVEPLHRQGSTTTVIWVVMGCSVLRCCASHLRRLTAVEETIDEVHKEVITRRLPTVAHVLPKSEYFDLVPPVGQTVAPAPEPFNMPDGRSSQYDVAAHGESLEKDESGRIRSEQEEDGFLGNFIFVRSLPRASRS